MSDDKTQSTKPDNSGQPTTTQNNAGQQATSQNNTRQPETTSMNELVTPVLYCPKCKAFRKIDSTEGADIRPLEKEETIKEKRTPIDIASALFEKYKQYAKHLPKGFHLPKNIDKFVSQLENKWATYEPLIRYLMEHKIYVKLECGHGISITPYKVFDALADGYYAIVLLEYLKLKRPAQKDFEKQVIAEFVANSGLLMAIALAYYLDQESRKTRETK